MRIHYSYIHRREHRSLNGLVYRWLANSLALFLTTYIVDGLVIKTLWAALVGAAVLGLVNATIKPALFWLTLPISVFSLGLFTFVLNGFMLMLTAWVVRGFEVSGFWPAVLGALVLTVISAILSIFVPDEAR